MEWIWNAATSVWLAGVDRTGRGRRGGEGGHLRPQRKQAFQQPSVVGRRSLNHADGCMKTKYHENEATAVSPLVVPSSVQLKAVARKTS